MRLHGTKTSGGHLIGVLDIDGFEVFRWTHGERDRLLVELTRVIDEEILRCFPFLSEPEQQSDSGPDEIE